MKEISREDYLKALGLWTLASGHWREGAKIEDALNKFLGLEAGSWLSDSMLDDGISFDDALEKENIAVVDP